MGLTLLLHTGLPLKFWDYAFETAVYLINRLSTKFHHYKTPYELMYGHVPKYDHLHVFGCLCYTYLRPYTQNKLEPRSRMCVFLGYPSHYHGFRCLDLTTGRIYISSQVVFDEQSFPYRWTSFVSEVHSVQSSGPPSASEVRHPPSNNTPATTSTSISLSPSLTDPTTIVSQITDLHHGVALFGTQVSSLALAAVPTTNTGSQRTHQMVTRSCDGTLPPKRSTISRHPVAFSVTDHLQEPKIFAKA